jgi:subtilisin family serine protease/uncharacterized membrane protein
MNPRTFLTILVSLLLLLSATPTTIASGPVAWPVVHAVVEQPHLLRLRAGDFDPVQGIPLPKELLTNGRVEYYIVQFDGPIDAQWVLAIEDIDCQVVWYLPDDAYVVWAPGTSQSELSALPHVRYVGPYHTGYKLSPDLFKGPEAKVIYITPLRDPVTVAMAIVLLGGTVTAINENLVRGYLPEVGFIEPGGGGSFLMDNDARILRARQNIDGNFTNDGLSLWSWNGSAFQGVTGKGVRVMVTDTGIDGTHPDFAGRKVYFSSMNAPYSNWTDYFGHGTHCSGIILGNGSYRPPPAPQGQNGTYAGIAPEALLMGEIIDWDLNDDLMYGITVNDVIRDTEAHGAQVSSNSWSCCGTVQVYGVTAQIYDNAVRDSNLTTDGNQSIVYVFAAGNSGAGNIITPGVAKNVITVGATGDRRGLDENSLAGFSSRGPTADGRRKPDVVAPGVNVVSALANNPNFSFVGMSGTSMATPGVAGASTLVIDYYNQTYGLSPSPAMVKSILVNGADQMNNPAYKYADSNQGWGRVNLSRSLLETNGRKVWGEDQKHSISTGQDVDYYFNVTESKELRVHMAYTDPGAAPPVSRALVNDLDLIAFAPNGTQYNASHFVNDYSAPGGTPDNLNNVEGLRFKSPSVGQWHVRVHATDIPMGPQDYAITVNGWTDISLHDIDLRALNITFSTSSPVEGQTVQWTARFVNDGLVPSVGSMYYFRLDGNSIQTATTPTIARHEVAVLTGNWTAKRGAHTFSLEVDPLDMIKETNELNNIVSTGLFVDYYGLDVSAKAINDSVPPGTAAEWQINIRNTGTLPDEYDIAHPSAPNGWSVTALSAVQLEPGAGQVVTVKIGTPSNGLAGGRLVVPFTITSKALPSLEQKVIVHAILAQAYALAVTVGPDSQFVEPDGQVVYNITITNQGNGPDTFGIVWTLRTNWTDDWQVGTSKGHVQLDPGGSVVVPLYVYAVRDALAFETCDIDVTVTSLGHPGTKASGTVHVLVAPRYELMSSLDPTVTVLAPGEHSEHILRISNLGNSYAGVGYSVKVPDHWTTIHGGGGDLAASGIWDFKIRVDVPEDTLAGDYECQIETYWRNVSRNEPIGKHTITVRVTPEYLLSLFVEPKLLNGTTGDSFVLRTKVVNEGNAIDDVHIEISGMNDNWALIGGPFTFLARPGGVETDSEFTIQTMNGTAGNYTIVVTATSYAPWAPSVKVPMTLHSPPPPPPPVIPPPPKPEPKPNNNGLLIMYGLVLLVVIIIAVVVIVLLMRRRGRRPVDVQAPLAAAAGPTQYPETPAPTPGPPPKGPVPEEGPKDILPPPATEKVETLPPKA